MVTMEQQAVSASVEPSPGRRGLRRITVMVATLLVVFALVGLFAALSYGTTSHPCATHRPTTAGVPLCRR